MRLFYNAHNSSSLFGLWNHFWDVRSTDWATFKPRNYEKSAVCLRPKFESWRLQHKQFYPFDCSVFSVFPSGRVISTNLIYTLTNNLWAKFFDYSQLVWIPGMLAISLNTWNHSYRIWTLKTSKLVQSWWKLPNFLVGSIFDHD